MPENNLVERRQNVLKKDELIQELIQVFRNEHAHLSKEEHEWVKLAIQKEAQSIKLRQAIIEKTLSGLVWAVIVGAGYLILDFFKNHGFK